MSSSLRTSEATPLVEWLSALLGGAALQSVRVPEPRAVVLELRVPGRTVRLLISVERGFARFHPVERPPPNPRQQYALQGLLRKELRGRVEELALLGGDRVLSLRIGTRRLVAILVPRHEDLVLLDDRGDVLGSASGAHARGTPVALPPPRDGGPPSRFGDLEAESLADAVRAFFEAATLDRSRTAIRRRLVKRRSALQRLVSKRTAEAARAGDADALQRRADLLQGAFGKLRRGMTEIEVDDFYEGGRRVIRLEPALDPGDNVRRAYKAARRARRSADQATVRLTEARAELAEVLGTLELLEEAGSAEDLSAVAGLAPAPKPRGRTKAGTRLPYSSWRAPGGSEIRVGRGARDNDDLTFRHSKGNDLWLHVKDRPGAHVVVRDAGPAPSTELLLLAAQLAMAHSGLSPGTRAEVSWTRVKEVRKPPGMAPGAVLVRSKKVLYVELDPLELEKLQRQ